MVFYVLLFFIILYKCLLLCPVRNKSRSFIYIATFILFMISGLRHEAVGNDTYATMLSFEYVSQLSWSDILANFWEKYFYPNYDIGKDPAENVLLKLLSYFCPNARVFLIVFAAIILFSLGYIIYQLTNELRTTLLIYIFFVSFFYQYIPNSSVRQPIAFIIVYLGYLQLRKYRTLNFLLLLFFASLFHKSALIAIIMIPLFYVKQTAKIYKFSLLAFVLMLFLYRIAGNFLIGTNDIYSYYLTSSYYSGTKPTNVIILYFIFYIVGWFLIKRDQFIEQHSIEYMGTALSLVLVPLIWIDPSMLRIVAYFALFIPMLMTRSSFLYKNNVVVIILTLVLLFKSIGDDGYRFMWQYKELHERYSLIVPKNNCFGDNTLCDSNCNFIA